MKQYEVTFIVDPVLSADEIKSTVATYEEMLKNEGCKLVAKAELGLKQLAYAINKRSSGYYFVLEFTSENGEIIGKIELALRRDQRIMRFLSVALDKFGIKYNQDKREGKIANMKDRIKKEGGEAAPTTSTSNAQPKTLNQRKPVVAENTPTVDQVKEEVVTVVEDSTSEIKSEVE